ncbi:MAG TPA: hypothetical protein VFQ17_01080 [Nocardioides sp.]|nr:hypothetical protein [Nocardioides sp.]
MRRGMRTSRTLAATALILVSVSWGATASAAPQAEKEPARAPIVVPHLMSSCGNMDGI